jgi:hypothetical protein
MKNLIIVLFLIISSCTQSGRILSSVPPNKYFDTLRSNESVTGCIYVDWDWRKNGMKTWFVDYWLVEGKYYRTTSIFKNYPNGDEKTKLRVKRVSVSHINKFNKKVYGD